MQHDCSDTDSGLTNATVLPHPGERLDGTIRRQNYSLLAFSDVETRWASFSFPASYHPQIPKLWKERWW
jgi:hypothetical protein